MTVTEVDVTKDLRSAKVYVSVLGSEAQWQARSQALESARGFIRNWLLPRLRLRAVPHLTFLPIARWPTPPTSRRSSRGSRAEERPSEEPGSETPT